MAERMDVLAPREYTQNGEKKTAYNRVGVAWETQNGGWSVKLEAVPVPQANQKTGALEVNILLMPPRDNSQQGGGGYNRPAAQAPSQPNFDGPDEDIPFNCDRRL